MKAKTIIQSIIIIAICGSFGKHLIFGKKGIREYFQLQKESEFVKKEICTVNQEITHLQSSIQKWTSDDFEKEKVAREDLQMGHPNELVYVVE